MLTSFKVQPKPSSMKAVLREGTRSIEQTESVSWRGGVKGHCIIKL